MSLAMPVVWSDSCRLHDPGGEIWIGVRTEGTEVAARVDAVREALVGNGARIVAAEGHPDESLLRVHDDSLLSYLASAWEEWTAAGLPEDPGQDRVVPYVFAHASLTSGPPSAHSGRNLGEARLLRLRHDDPRSAPAPGRRPGPRSTSH